MSNETHKHYHINVLPQDPVAWIFIASAIMIGSICWGMSRSDIAKAEVEKAKIEAQNRVQIVQEKS